jgi:hypothetical protein
MAQNGRTSFILPDSEGRAGPGSNGAAAQYHDASRRRDQLVRRESARRSGLFTPSALHEADSAYSPKNIEQAAQQMCEMLKNGRLSRTQLQQEQREDADRITGWRATGPPDPETDGAELVRKYQYRMAVRNRALELYDAYDLNNLTNRTRSGQTVAGQPEWKPWRKGAAGGGKVY